MNNQDKSIIVNSVTKIYPLYKSHRDRLKEALHPFRKKYHHDFYAVKEVSFEVGKGETVGIIGRNGSGKSTLLSIIAGVLQPSKGNVYVKGRVSSLLELGAGFNPDLSGLENIKFLLSVQGQTTQFIAQKIEQIVEFSGVGEFIHQPVKLYSSGMYVRLAFAVAISVEPEILIIDEALSVGDELFQRKCFSRIEEIKKKGATILFVSHAMGTIIEFCDRAILIDNSEKLAEGEPKKIIGLYQKLLYAPPDKSQSIRKKISQMSDSLSFDIKNSAQSIIPEFNKFYEENNFLIADYFDENLVSKSQIEYESHGVQIKNVRIISASTGEKINCINKGGKYKYIYEVHFYQYAVNVRFGMLLKTTTGYEIGGFTTSENISNSIPFLEKNSIYQIEFEFECNLNPGIYFLNAGVLGVHDNNEIYLHRILDVLTFKVLPVKGNLSTAVVDFKFSPFIKKINVP